MKWLWTLVTTNWQERLIMFGILSALVAGVYFKGYYAGKASVQVAQAKETIKTVEKVKVIHDKVNAMPVGASVVELRRSWQR